MTHPNELKWTPSNNSPERIYMGARMTKTKLEGRAEQTSCTNMHKANPRSQLSIFDTGSFARARPHLNDPSERVDTDARTILHGRPHDQNEGTRENQENKLHERAQSQPQVIT